MSTAHLVEWLAILAAVLALAVGVGAGVAGMGWIAAGVFLVAGHVISKWLQGRE